MNDAITQKAANRRYAGSSRTKGVAKLAEANGGCSRLSVVLLQRWQLL